MNSLEKMKLCAGFAYEKKAGDLIVLDVHEHSAFTDYFIICSGGSTRQVQAVAENVQQMMKDRGLLPLGVEGVQNGRWVLLDYDDVIMHVFHEEERSFYGLETLWHQCPRVACEDPHAPKSRKK